MTPHVVAAVLMTSAAIFVLDRSLSRREAERMWMRLASPGRGSPRAVPPTARSGGSRWILVVASATAALPGWWLAGPVGALAGPVGAWLGIRAATERRNVLRRQAEEAQLVDAIAALAAGSRAGLSIRGAVREAARDVEQPLRGRLESVSRRLGVGEPLEAALTGIVGAGTEGRLLAALLGAHQRTGGELSTLLDEITAVVRDRVEARRHARALTAQGRASGVVLSVLPIAFVVLLSGAGGSDLGAFYRTGQGAALLAAGLVLQAVGFLWIRQIVRERA